MLNTAAGGRNSVLFSRIYQTGCQLLHVKAVAGGEALRCRAPFCTTTTSSNTHVGSLLGKPGSWPRLLLSSSTSAAWRGCSHTPLQQHHAMSSASCSNRCSSCCCCNRRGGGEDVARGFSQRAHLLGRMCLARKCLAHMCHPERMCLSHMYPEHMCPGLLSTATPPLLQLPIASMTMLVPPTCDSHVGLSAAWQPRFHVPATLYRPLHGLRRDMVAGAQVQSVLKATTYRYMPMTHVALQPAAA
jgi:hypothetical protein